MNSCGEGQSSVQMHRNVDSFNRDLSSTNVVRLRDTAIDKAGFLPLRS